MQVTLPNKQKCPFCWEIAGRDSDWALAGFSCSRCGEFRVEPALAQENARALQPMVAAVVAIAGWIRSQNAAGIQPTIYREDLAAIVKRPIPALKMRAMLLLRVLADMCPKLDMRTYVADGHALSEMLGVSYSADYQDLLMPLAILQSDGYVKRSGEALQVTIDGHLRLEDDDRKGGSLSKAFVAMNFDRDFDEAWTVGFSIGITNAGYVPFRINEKEFIGGITDEIISEIKQSKFLIADYSGHKNGVYFEAGFALGLGLDVIQSCHVDHMEKLHFDIKHLNTIVWDNPADLAGKIEKRIRAVIGKGPAAFTFPWEGGQSLRS